MQRLLVMACSQKKSSEAASLPALEMYDGPAFRVLRKYLRDSSDRSLTVLILSAEHGLIDAGREIARYDRRLRRAMALELRPKVMQVAARVLSGHDWEAAAVCAGKDYATALEGLGALMPGGVRLEMLGGGLGRRLTGLRDWLRRPSNTPAGRELVPRRGPR